MEELLDTVELLSYELELLLLTAVELLPLIVAELLPDDGRLYVVPDPVPADGFDVPCALPAVIDVEPDLFAATLLTVDEPDAGLTPVAEERDVELVVPMPRLVAVLEVNTLSSPTVSCLGPYQRSRPL